MGPSKCSNLDPQTVISARSYEEATRWPVVFWTAVIYLDRNISKTHALGIKDVSVGGWHIFKVHYYCEKNSDLSQKPPSVTWVVMKMSIQPGTAYDYFDISTTMLPAIVDYYVEGMGSVHCESEPPDDGIIHGYNDYTPYGPGIVGQTIGPGEYPEDPKDHVGSLVNQFEKAARLGWVTKGALYADLEQKLNNLHATNIRGILGNERLNEALKAIEELHKQRMCSNELYYLLKINLEYLKAKLR